MPYIYFLFIEAIYGFTDNLRPSQVPSSVNAINNLPYFTWSFVAVLCAIQATDFNNHT